MLVTWKRVQAGIYEAIDTVGNKYYISSGAKGWNVYNDNEGRGICGEYLFSADTLAEVKASLQVYKPAPEVTRAERLGAHEFFYREQEICG